MRPKPKVIGIYTPEDCDVWLAAMGWVRDREYWYSPDGTIEILSYKLSDEEMKRHPCVLKESIDATERVGEPT